MSMSGGSLGLCVVRMGDFLDDFFLFGFFFAGSAVRLGLLGLAGMPAAPAAEIASSRSAWLRLLMVLRAYQMLMAK
jgi:hypothetical protein